MKLALQTTVSASIAVFFKGQLAWLGENNVEVHTVCSPGIELEWITEVPVARKHTVLICRSLSIHSDLLALWKLLWLYRKSKFDIVHSFTPKAGLLGMLAATLAGCPVRVFSIWGLSEERSSLRSRLTWTADKISCALAHCVFVECSSIADLAVARGICPLEKIKVLPAWSTNFLLEYMDLNSLELARSEVRKQLNIPMDDFVFGFVGRVAKDKGVHELVAAFILIANEFPNVHLLVVGSSDVEDRISENVALQMHHHSRIHCVGFHKSVFRFLCAMDVLVHPSYREGLPTAPLEASAIGIPVIATRIAGCIDAVQDGYTGLLVPPRDAKAIGEAMRCYIEDSVLCRKHGAQGRKRILMKFEPSRTWIELLDEYKRLVSERNIR